MASIKILLQLLRRADWSYLTKADILAVRHDNDCGQIFDGKYYSPLIDSILDEIQKKKIITVASPYSYRLKQRSYAGALGFNGAFAREWVVKHFKRALGLSSDEVYLDTWRRIICTVRPKYVLSIQPHSALCRACHEQGVIVFDIQHGYIGPNNPSYGQKFQVGRKRKDIADCILCWDEHSADLIRGWTSLQQIELRVIGNPWINKFLMRREQDEVPRFFADRSRSDRPVTSRPSILVSLQWGLDNPAVVPDLELFDNEFMPIALETAIRNTQEQFSWILRPHPVQYMNPVVFNKLVKHVQERFGSKVRISENDPLPCVLSGVQLHITYNSSVVIEAAFYGVQSALLDPQIDGGIWDGYFADQIEKGMARLIPCNASAIQDWMYALCLDPGTQNQIPALPQAYTEFLQELEEL